MMRRVFYSLLFTGLIASGAYAQQALTDRELYCSGVVTSDAVPSDTYVITGSDSYFRIVYSEHNLVFLNKGSSQGVKVGDQFEVIRPVPSDRLKLEWFKSQNQLLKGMGTTYEDEARLQVVNVQPNTSTAEIVFSCGYVQRGDIVQPFMARQSPAVKSAESFDRFAPASGKAKAMVVTTQYYGQAAATGKIIYVNLGSSQGIKVGDYFRMFRFQGNTSEAEYQTPHLAYQVFGFGSAPRPYTGAELPREILGEGVVLRVSKNAATVLTTFSAKEIYAGDYVELE